MSRPRRARTNWSRPAAKWSSRSFGRRGLLDPVIEVVPARGQVPHLAGADSRAGGRGERVLVTTLTKRLAEDLSAYFAEAGRVAASGCTASWMRSSAWSCCAICAKGKFDVLVGVNLLREGLDLPEVSLVAILDADKEGFLRSETSLMQTIGRAARNVNAKVILYADKVTDSMQRAIDETRAAAQAAGGVQPASTASRRRRSRRRSARGSSRRRRPTPRPTRPSAARTRRSTSPRSTSPNWKPRCWPRPRRWSSSGRRRSATGSRRCESRSASGRGRLSWSMRHGRAAGGDGRRGECRGRKAGIRDWGLAGVLGCGSTAGEERAPLRTCFPRSNCMILHPGAVGDTSTASLALCSPVQPTLTSPESAPHIWAGLIESPRSMSHQAPRLSSTVPAVERNRRRTPGGGLVVPP